MTLLDKYFPVSDSNKQSTINKFPTVASNPEPARVSLVDKYFPKKIETVEVKKPTSPITERAVGIANEIGKFAVRSGVELSNLLTSTLDFSADFLATSIESKIKAPKIGIGDSGLVTTGEKAAAEKWRKFYESSVGKGTENLKTFTQNLRNLEYIKPSDDWVNSSTKDKLTKKLPETILNIGPGIVASLGSFAINPALGFAVSAGSVADEVSSIAKENGVDNQKSETLGLGTGLLVGMLDKVVPDELFSPKEKQAFVGGLAKRAAQYALKTIKTGSKEAITEVLQEDVQILAESAVRNDVTKDEVKVRNIMAGLGGFLGGSGAQSVTSFINNIRSGDIAGIDQEEVQAAKKDQLSPEVKVNKSLLGDEKSAQDFSISFYQSKQDEFMQNYLKRVEKEFGSTNIVSADEAKYAIPEFNETKSRAYHEVSSAFSKKYAQQLLSDPKNTGKPILLMAGGSGAGKTTALRSFENFNDYALVFDSNLSSKDSVATKLIDQALEQGRKVDVDLVLRDPKTAFEGVLKRVKTRGRIVPIDIHVKNTVGSIETVRSLAKDYGERINVKVYDNNGSLEDVREIPIETLDNLSYNKGDLTTYLNDRVNKAVQNGEITEKQASIFRSAGAETASGTQQADDKRVQESSDQAEQVVQEQISNAKDIKDVRRTLKSIRGELDATTTEAEGKATLAAEQREGLNTEDIAKLKRLYATTDAFQEGDIETVRASKHRELVNSVVENVQEKYPDMTEAEAYDFALNLPTKSAEKARTPEIVALEKKEKKLRGYLDQLKEKEKQLNLKEDAALTKEWEEVVAAQERLTKIVRVPEAQIPVGEGAKRVSRLEARVRGVFDTTNVEEKEKLGLATYNQVNNKDNIAAAIKYIDQNPDNALKILKGEMDPPAGILRNAIYVAMKEIGSTDTELATKIASLEATRLGQELSILQEIDADSPVSLMESVVKARIEGYERKSRGSKKAEARVKEETKKLDKITKAPDAKEWDSFLQSIAC